VGVNRLSAFATNVPVFAKSPADDRRDAMGAARLAAVAEVKEARPETVE
jgi:hypothetical protein